jgi:hypothetical protein
LPEFRALFFPRFEIEQLSRGELAFHFFSITSCLDEKPDKAKDHADAVEVRPSPDEGLIPMLPEEVAEEEQDKPSLACGSHAWINRHGSILTDLQRRAA